MDIADKEFKACSTNKYNELKETMLKELNVSLTTINQQIEILNKKLEIIKKTQMIILKLKFIITKMKKCITCAQVQILDDKRISGLEDR